MADGGHVYLVPAQLDIEGNSLTKIQKKKKKKKTTGGLGGDAITSLSVGNFTKSEPGTKRPNLSTDRIFFCTFTTRH